MDISGVSEFGWPAAFWTTVFVLRFRKWTRGDDGLGNFFVLIAVGLLVFVADSCLIFSLFNEMPEDLSVAEAEATLDGMTAFALSTWIAWRWIGTLKPSTTQPVDE